MKLIVSSSYLYKVLSDSLSDGLLFVKYKDQKLLFTTPFETRTVRGYSKELQEISFSTDINWEYLREVLAMTPEQPITLRLFQGFVKFGLEIDSNLANKKASILMPA